MTSTSSPPAEALEIRGRTLTPASPKPVLLPSPSNIPILEKQMDPVFGETASQMPEINQSSVPPTQDLPDSLIPSNEFADGLAQVIDQSIEASGNGAMGDTMTLMQNQDTSMEDASAKNSSTDQINHAFATEAISNTLSAEQSALLAPSLPFSSTNALSQPPQAPSQSETEGAQATVENGRETPVASENAGGINIQTLLDNLSPSITNAAAPQGEQSNAVPVSANDSHVSTSDTAISPSSIQGNPNLPPRPPPQEKPISHPNYSGMDDIRSFHPHSQKTPATNSNSQHNIVPPQTGSAPILTIGANGLPPPPPASFQGSNQTPTDRIQSPLSALQEQKDDTDKKSDKASVSDEEVQWSPEIQKIYDDFLQDERKYVTEGQWDKFPANSRLFIGNLPTEKVTKRDLFQLFYRHGKLAQISIKQAYGFIQFLDSGACQKALQAEQGVAVRGRKMHLEISKPQRNRGGDNNRGNRRRSRSADHNRNSYGSRGIDRYTSGQNGTSPRDREFRRGRDDYRPNRSPSPRGYRDRRDRSRDRSRGRYNGRRRSRSRSPYGRGNRYRSPSPRRDSDDDLPLPRRAPRDVPDVQMIVLDDLDRNFIAYIEKSFQDRGVRCDVLLLSPRLSESAVIRRQILEGVHAVSRMTRVCQQTGRIPLQVFDRRAGSDNVRFEEYDNLDPSVCAELVTRAKKNNSDQVASPYGVPASYGMPLQYGLPTQPQQPQSQPPLPPQQQQQPHQQPHQPVGVPNANNLGSLISSMDAAGLQKLLSSMQQQPASQNPSVQTSGLTPDLSRLLSGASGNVLQAQHQPTATAAAAYGQPSQAATTTQPNTLAALSSNPAFASLLSGAGGAGALGAVPAQGQQPMQHGAPHHGLAGQPDMQEIMAQLAKYRR